MGAVYDGYISKHINRKISEPMARLLSNNDKPSMVAPTAIHHHFSKIAHRYRNLRTTDLEPIILIAQKLIQQSHIKAADIGCGTGRYDQLLFQYLGDKLHLSCVDANDDMLGILNTYLQEHDISNFTFINSKAESLPFPNNDLDCIYTFNAVHHFNLPNFLKESARIMKGDSYLFIYTRLPKQNMRNIWGRYFPEFCNKETRLYTMNTFMKAVADVPQFSVESIEYFKYKRISTLDQLMERVRSNHYSTFWLYSPEELQAAITGFVQNINNQYEDTDDVNWFDENIMFVIRKKEDLDLVRG